MSEIGGRGPAGWESRAVSVGPGARKNHRVGRKDGESFRWSGPALCGAMPEGYRPGPAVWGSEAPGAEACGLCDLADRVMRLEPKREGGRTAGTGAGA